MNVRLSECRGESALSDEYKKLNEEALKSLEDGDFDKAQSLLVSNAKRYPNGCTLNNLGVFYMNCGIRQKNGKLVSAWKNGFKYLIRAAEADKNTTVLSNIGVELFQVGEYEKAYDYFLDAYTARENHLLKYNMGICRYMSGNYAEAADVLGSLQDRSSFDEVLEALGLLPLFPYCFSLISLGKKTECKRALKEYAELYLDELCSTDNIYDAFTLLFMCGEYDEASIMMPKIAQYWLLDYPIIAMFAECAEKAHIGEVEENARALISDDLLNSKTVDNIFNNNNVREKYLSKFKYVPTYATLNPWCY